MITSLPPGVDLFENLDFLAFNLRYMGAEFDGEKIKIPREKIAAVVEALMTSDEESVFFGTEFILVVRRHGDGEIIWAF